ncbi:MAG: hypothetical protein WBA13_01465 [Microcoleaceae cyanobacterium]
MNLPTDLLEKVTSLPNHSIIGISGFGGSGKSTLANTLSNQLNCDQICTDSFMTDVSNHQLSCWNNIDYTRLIDEIIIPFNHKYKTLTYSHFDSNINAISEKITIKTVNNLMIEGVGLFHPDIMKYLTFALWVECPLQTAIARGKQRDRFVHHNPKDQLWDGVWKNNDLEFFEKFSPDKNASFIFNNSDDFEKLFG